jgi:two-component system, NarL family, nitrate/nitrite response regulator NarL
VNPLLVSRAPQRAVVVADDHPLYRAGIVRALLESGRFADAHEASDGERAYELIADMRPALAVVDVRMPRLDGIGVISRLAAHDIRVPVLLLSAVTRTDVVERALAAGATGYLAKHADRDDIVAAAEAVALGARMEPRVEDEERRPQLRPIERRILRVLLDGWSPAEVPRLTGLDGATVERYLRDAATRLGVETPAQAVTAALAWGLLEPYGPI